jgi:hypothetical protein
MTRVEWRGDEFSQKAEAEINKRLKVVGAALQAYIVKSMKTSGRSHTAASKWGLGPIRSRERMRVGKNKSVYIFRSKPGEVPHAQTGLLRQSIFWDLRKGSSPSVIVGTPLKYGRALELGNEKGNLLPRPYLLPALEAMQWRIQGILTKPFRFS